MDPNQTTQTTTTTQADQTTAAPTVPAEIVARLTAYEAEVKALREESAGRRVKAKEATAAAEKLAEEQGQFKALAESLKSRVAELEPLQTDAQQWRDHLARETSRLAKVREGLPVHWQSALDASPSVDGKQAILAAYEAEQAARQPAGREAAKPPSSGAPPGATVTTDWEALASNPVALRDAKARDPSGWQTFVARLRGSAGRPQTTQERRLALAKK